jgi:hypothetical protein
VPASVVVVLPTPINAGTGPPITPILIAIIGATIGAIVGRGIIMIVAMIGIMPGKGNDTAGTGAGDTCRRTGPARIP